MNIQELKHFKLSNGDEIVCDVIEWPEDESADIVVRNCYQLIAYGQAKDGIRYYQFRPWMVYQDDPEFFQVINNNHIIAEANPPHDLVEQFVRVVSENFEADEATSHLDAKIDEYMESLKRQIDAQTDNVDEIKPNVLPFKPKVH